MRRDGAGSPLRANLYADMTAEAPTTPLLAPPVTVAAPTTDRVRLVGPDVVRAAALIGVCVMNYHGYLINQGGELSRNFWGRFFHPWEGPLSTRFAATFVLTAGVGVTLLTRRATASRHDNPAAVAAKRWTLIRRGLVLYGFGLIFYEIWSGSILPYYGAMFVIAAFLFTLATPWLVAIGVASAVAGAGIHWWVIERNADGHSTRMAHQSADQLAAWPAVQRVRQRHPSAVPVAGVPVRRDDPRAAAARRLVDRRSEEAGVVDARGARDSG